MRIELGSYSTPKRGYLYYAVNPVDAAKSRLQRTRLSEIAGTGEAVAFGGFFPGDPERGAGGIMEGARDETLAASAHLVTRYNGTVRRAGDPPANPDRFPLPLRPGHSSVRPLANHPVIADVLRVPEALSPADGAAEPAGVVELVTRNVTDPTVTYHFEIEDAQGMKTTSPPIVAGEGRTSWSPAVQMEAGVAYTWRVWVRSLESERTYPVAEAAFRTSKR